MNQFENETLRLAAVLFVAFCIVFTLFRRRSAFWSSLPRWVIVASLAWFVCALVVITTVRTSFFQGPVFMLAYFVVAFMTPPLLAAGMLEVVVGTYASFLTQDRIVSFPARSHFVAAFSIFACIGAYVVYSTFSK
jgi:hypothetical protein